MSIEGTAFETFANCKTLQHLWLDYVDNFTDEGAKRIAKIPNLKELKIHKGYGRSKLTSAGVKAIGRYSPRQIRHRQKSCSTTTFFISLVKKGWLCSRRRLVRAIRNRNGRRSQIPSRSTAAR